MIQEFHHPTSIAEAVRLRQASPASLYFAGGTEINSITWPSRPVGEFVTAILLDRLPLGDVTTADGAVTIGANVTIQELVDRPGVPPMLATAASQFSSRSVRHMGTVGGNIASNGSCSNLAPVLLALDASVELADAAGQRFVPLVDYLEHQDREALILAFRIPNGWQSRRWAVQKHCRTAIDVPIVAIGLTCGGNAQRIEQPIIALNGAVPHATRLTALEQRLHGQPLPSRDEVDDLVRQLVQSADDLRGSAAFKRHLAAVMISDGLREALDAKG
jgi:putative selenate reductase FAD-binding subunit